jgi:hypothetical protein
VGIVPFAVAVLAQEAADDGPEACSPEARRVARFVSRALHWENRRPIAERRSAVGDGELWYAVDMQACCSLDETCGGSSEADDALVGVVGERRFALTDQSLPTLEFAPVEPWAEPLRLRGWSRFLAAAHAIPTSTEDALSLGRTIVGGLRPGLKLVRGEEELQAILAAKTDSAETAAAARETLREDGGDVVESGAVERDGGFDVTIWISDFAPDDDGAELRRSSSGFSSSEGLQRIRLRIESAGTVLVEEDVAFIIPGCGVGRWRPHPQVVTLPAATP